MDISPLLTSRTVAIVGLVCIALSALAALWAMVKLSYQRALGRPMPRNALTGTLDVLAELAVNVVGAVSRALKLGTGDGLFRPTVPLTPAEAARPTIAPPEAIDPAQRGSIDIATLLAIGSGAMALLCVVVAIALSAQGCIPVRRFVLDHTSGVPARGPCVPDVHRCATTDAGLAVPVVCSADHREWSSLPLRPDGSERTCAPGEGCSLTDAGVARCTAADAR
jgi:hypothetical protein